MGLNNSQEEKVNEIFKLKIPGLMYCQYCKNYVKLFENSKLEFIKHFSEFSHLKYFFDQCYRYPKKTNGDQKQEQYVIGIAEAKYEKLIKYIKTREAYCQLCNSCINLGHMHNIRTQFWIHFLDEDSHQHFIDQLDIKYDQVEKNNEFEELKLCIGKNLQDKISRKLADKLDIMKLHQIESLRKQYLNRQPLEKVVEEKHHHNQLSQIKFVEEEGVHQHQLSIEKIVEEKGHKNFLETIVEEIDHQSLKKIIEEKVHQIKLSQEKVELEKSHQQKYSLEKKAEEQELSQVEQNLDFDSPSEQKHEQVKTGYRSSKRAKYHSQQVLEKKDNIQRLSSTINTPINKRLKKQ